MRYPVMIEAGNDSRAWGVVVPDLPGCFSAGDTLAEAMAAAEEAAAAWIDAARDAGREIPRPSPPQAAAALGDFAGWTADSIEVGGLP